MDRSVELVDEKSDCSDDSSGSVEVLISATKRPKPKLWRRALRMLLLFVATVLVAALCIQLWTNYGEVITEQVFPPRLVAAGRMCPNETVSSYRATRRNYTNGTLHITVPREDVLTVLSPAHPYVVSGGEDVCLAVNTTECVSFLMFTI